ncbi:MFS transporter [Streptomyces longwoodensis]|uniref:MFS transporter n=1 Tax=Streptomyces longwoodensis TaxID=68231 RepID=UPI003405903A
MKRPMLAYLASYSLSTLGNSVAAVVLPLLVLQTTGSALDAGVVAAATAVPAVLAGLFMGGVIDRVNRRSASIVTDLVSAAAVAALPLVDMVSGLAVGWFVLFGVVGSFGDVPGLTAREALVSQVAVSSGVTLDRLVALRESLGGVAMLVGPALGAGLVVVLDGSAALWLTAAFSLAAAWMTLFLPRRVGAVANSESNTSPRTLLRQMREGWTLLFRRSPLVLCVTVLNLVMVVVLAAFQGLLLPVHFTMSGKEGQLGLVLSSLAVGMLAGSAIYAAFGARAGRRTWLSIALLGSVVGLSLIGTLPSVWVIFVGAFVLGFFGGILSTILGVLMAERIPDHLRGRVTGTQNAMMTAAPSLGIFGTGILIEHASLTTAGLVATALWVVAVVTALLAPTLRDLAPLTMPDSDNSESVTRELFT